MFKKILLFRSKKKNNIKKNNPILTFAGYNQLYILWN